MLGAIADDFTGATDLATMLRRAGHRVSIVIEGGTLPPGDIERADAVIIALKTRTAPVREAVRSSREALAKLRTWGADRFYVKYCSTFDSTPTGNIGPVLDAVSSDLGASRVVVVPAMPDNGRTVHHGNLFVGDSLLENSPMRAHPLTPMTASRVADLLRPQTPFAVGEVFLPSVRAGSEVLRSAIGATAARYVVVDATDNDDLLTIGNATRDDILISGGSGLAIGLPGSGRTDGSWSPPPPGRRAVLCGSVSDATLAQIARAAGSTPVRMIDLPTALADPEEAAAEITSWVTTHTADAVPIVCAARTREDVVTSVDGRPVAAGVERVLGSVARRLVADGAVTAMIIAGGETSGAVVRALHIGALHVGPEITSGVCWCAANAEGQQVALALKSGNFGSANLFAEAWEALA
jgi:uncharacterized protein YgbK (DUF1537 family)